MNNDNWSQIKEILGVAIEQPPGRRTQFIRERCSGDVALQNRLESLIDSFDRIGDFMEDGAIGSVADTFASKNGLEPGSRLGRYTIVRMLGEGGMGTVYLADDPDLHRQVAVKVLRDDLWWYKQARQRLLREARAAARLDHPNICSIYEIEDSDERSFIVMQYVEGRTLSEIMVNGGMGGNQCLNVALQIADALEEAHSHHIIHRDIKPANIIIGEKGQAKVLDFGLAKSIEPEDGKPDDISSSGAVMGTVPYMSPEQLRGKAIDGRSDIFSFGALLFEMVSGHQAFGEDNNAETISAILNKQPNFSLVPRKFRPVVQKAMQKRAADRYQSISELSDDLRGLADGTREDTDQEPAFLNWFGTKGVISSAFRRYFSGRIPRSSTGRSYYRWQDSDSDARTVPLTSPILSEPVTARQPVQSHTRPFLLGGLAVLVLAAIPAVYLWSTRVQSNRHSFDKLHSVRLVEWRDAGSNDYLGYSSSHNGKLIAYSTKQDGPHESIYVKPIPDGSEVRVTKDEWVNSSPIWSPNDEKLAFLSYRDGTEGLYVVPFLGGETTLVKEVEDGTSLRHWSNDGSAIYFEFRGNLFRLDLKTGDAKQMTEFKPAWKPERYFALSPNEDQIAYCDVVNGQTDLWITPLKGGQRVRLTDDPEVEARPSWHPDGDEIIYDVIRDGYNQISVAYVDGSPPEQITRGEGEHLFIDVSADGKNIFYTTWEDRSDVWRIETGTGREFQVAGNREAEFWPDVSPDGKSILYQMNATSHPIASVNDSRIAIRTTDDAGAAKSFNGYNPRWLPDSRHIAFLRLMGAEKRVTLSMADTITDNTELVISDQILSGGQALLPYDRNQVRAFTWSPGNNEVTYVSNVSGAFNVYKKSLGESAAVSISQNSDPSVNYYSPLFSPRGKRIAYISVQKQAGGKRAVTSVWMEEGGNTRQIYSTTEGVRLLGWQRDDDLILELTDGVSNEGNLQAGPVVVRLTRLSVNGVTHGIEVLKNIHALSAALSVDGKTVAFTARQTDVDDIFIISTTGGLVKKVSSNSNPKTFLGSLTWSPEGKTIYFDKQERINTISMFENFR